MRKVLNIFLILFIALSLETKAQVRPGIDKPDTLQSGKTEGIYEVAKLRVPDYCIVTTVLSAGDTLQVLTYEPALQTYTQKAVVNCLTGELSYTINASGSYLVYDMFTQKLKVKVITSIGIKKIPIGVRSKQ